MPLSNQISSLIRGKSFSFHTPSDLQYYRSDSIPAYRTDKIQYPSYQSDPARSTTRYPSSQRLSTNPSQAHQRYPYQQQSMRHNSEMLRSSQTGSTRMSTYKPSYSRDPSPRRRGDVGPRNPLSQGTKRQTLRKRRSSSSSKNKFCKCVVSARYAGVPIEQTSGKCSRHLITPSFSKDKLTSDPGSIARHTSPKKCMKMTTTVFKSLTKSTLLRMAKAYGIRITDEVEDMVKSELQQLVAPRIPHEMKAKSFSLISKPKKHHKRSVLP